MSENNIELLTYLKNDIEEGLSGKEIDCIELHSEDNFISIKIFLEDHEIPFEK